MGYPVAFEGNSVIELVIDYHRPFLIMAHSTDVKSHNK